MLGLPRVFRAMTRPVLRQDLAVISAVTIGFVSLFMPWVFVSHPHFAMMPDAAIDAPLTARTFISRVMISDGQMTALDLLGNSFGHDAMMAIWLFGIGLIVALFTRLGGLVSAAGLLGFVVEVGPIARWHPYPYGFEVHGQFLIGYFIALVSTVVLMFGGGNFIWSIREHGNVPATARMTALMPRGTNLLRAPR